MPGQKLYPRATVKKIVKAHSNCNVSKNADIMIFLDYMLFMQTHTKQGGERGITARSVRKVTAVSALVICSADSDDVSRISAAHALL
ncbi:hypothetical protein N656DRAFT_761023 [Canariomyces notabilis]|uniref:Transcription factor CBF/NF-Y/archaeal histone domain-containing protein n=1 Tax=Canariomyces notabilis TaxID=2074819 RepID=A0AAN6QFK4_9PEZI|nr:hypothetical protein N656DRAFT_761023 [Canariomyces arenarius]